MTSEGIEHKDNYKSYKHRRGGGSSKEGHGRGRGDQGPPTGGLGQVPQARSGVGGVGAAAGGGAVGQGAVDEDGLGAVDVADGDEAAVERVVAAVADDAVDVGLVGVVVAAADLVGVAGAGHGLRLVAVRRLVVVVPRVPVRVQVRRVVPHAGPEGHRRQPAHQHEGHDAARRARARAVGHRRAAAVVSPTAV